MDRFTAEPAVAPAHAGQLPEAGAAFALTTEVTDVVDER
jgi:hypothetical protein